MAISFVVYLFTTGKVHDVTQVVAFVSSFFIICIKVGYIVEEGRENLYLIKHGDIPWYYLFGESPINAFFGILAFVVYFVTTWWLWWIAVLCVVAIFLWYMVCRKIK